MLRKIIKSCLAAALVCSMAAPAYAAAEWNMYGSVKMDAWQETHSKEQSDTGKSYSQLNYSLETGSRIGAKVQDGDLGGRFEYGFDENATARLLYGTWKTGSGTLLVGQDYGITNLFISNQAYGAGSGLLTDGGLYTGRVPQVKFKTNFGLNIAAIVPNQAEYDEGIFKLETDDLKELVTFSLPKLEFGYSFSSGSLDAGIVYGMQSEKRAIGTKSATVSSSALGLYGTVKFGTVKVSLNYNMATNGENYGVDSDWNSPDVMDKAEYDSVGDKLNEAKMTGMVFVASASLSDTMGVEVGYGSRTDNSGASGAKDDSHSVVYVNLPLMLASNFKLIPELGSFDYQKDASEIKQGGRTYVGARWSIDF